MNVQVLWSDGRDSSHAGITAVLPVDMLPLEPRPGVLHLNMAHVLSVRVFADTPEESGG